MRVHPIFLLGEIAATLNEIEVPGDIDGRTTPYHAWRMGYLAALQRVTDALTEKGSIGFDAKPPTP